MVAIRSQFSRYRILANGSRTLLFIHCLVEANGRYQQATHSVLDSSLVSVLPGLTIWVSVPWTHLSRKASFRTSWLQAVYCNSVLANGCHQLAVYLLPCRGKWLLTIYSVFAMGCHPQQGMDKWLLSPCSVFTCMSQHTEQGSGRWVPSSCGPC